MIAALFVQTGGCYFGLDEVDPWDEARDARLYRGPWPVVAHPPCGTWGAFARSGLTRRPLGDDEGCFEAALAAVRLCGGVLEHPAESSAWLAHGLLRPQTVGWSAGDFQGGWVCAIDQGHYGHRARKPTWLYASRCALPTMQWGAAPDCIKYKYLGHRERAATPLPFRDLLLGIARSAERRAA